MLPKISATGIIITENIHISIPKYWSAYWNSISGMAILNPHDNANARNILTIANWNGSLKPPVACIFLKNSFGCVTTALACLYQLSVNFTLSQHIFGYSPLYNPPCGKRHLQKQDIHTKCGTVVPKMEHL